MYDLIDIKWMTKFQIYKISYSTPATKMLWNLVTFKKTFDKLIKNIGSLPSEHFSK